MQKQTIQTILRKLSAEIPNPKTELKYNSDFELLIAVLLSARTTDNAVNKATAELFKVANTPEKMASLGEAKLKTYIKSIGFYNAKAKNVVNTAKTLIAEYHAKVPATQAELESLPGIGRKSANVILNTLYGKATIAVDTHVLRVANRIGLAKGKKPEDIEQQLETNIPDNYKQNISNLLILHGRYTCVARKPKCQICPISQYCEYFRNQT